MQIGTYIGIPGLGASPSPGPLPVSYPLDEVAGAVAAWNVNKLSSTYSGDALVVRRSSDDAELAIGFDASGNLDTAAMLAHCGAGDGFVSRVYDQTGNNRDMVQANTAKQPRIVNQGVVETDIWGNVGWRYHNGDTSGTELVCDSVGDAFFDLFDATVIVHNCHDQKNLADSLNTFFRAGYRDNGIVMYGDSAWVGNNSTVQQMGDNPYFNRTGHPTLRTLTVTDADARIYQNTTLNKTVTRTVAGPATHDNVLFGPSYGGSDNSTRGWVSGGMIYPALNDTDRLAVERSYASRVELDIPVTETNWTLITPYSERMAQLMNWVDSLTVADVTVPLEQTMSWDGDYSNYTDEELFRTQFQISTSLNDVWRRSPKWFVRDDGAGAGYEGSGTFRWDDFDSNMVPRLTCDLRNANGSQANPYFNNTNAKKRALAHAIVGMTAYYGWQTEGAWNGWPDFSGGTLNGHLYTFEHCMDVLSEELQSTLMEACYFYLHMAWEWTPRQANYNIDTKLVEAACRFAKLSDVPAHRALAIEICKKCLLGKYDAVFPSDYDSSQGGFYAPGYFAEAQSPETTYNGVSIFYVTRARIHSYGIAGFEFLDEILKRACEWKKHQFFYDTFDGRWDSGCTYAGRTANSVIWDQRQQAETRVALAALYEEGRPFLRYPIQGGGLVEQLGDDASIVSSIQSDISAFNASDLTELTDTPPAWTSVRGNQHWPEDDDEAIVPGTWAAPLRALVAAEDATTKYPIEFTSLPYKKQLDDSLTAVDNEWTFYKGNDGAADFACNIEHLSRGVSYNSWLGGQEHTIWFDGIGAVFMTGWDRVTDDISRDYTIIDQWPTGHIWGINASDVGFSNVTHNLKARSGAVAPPVMTTDMEASPPFVQVKSNLFSQNGASGDLIETEAGTHVTNRFEFAADGVDRKITIVSPGTYSVKELWYTQPVRLRDATHQSGISDAVIQYHDGTGWKTLTETPVSGVTWLRVTKNFEDGNGDKTAFVNISTASTVRGTAPFQCDYQSSNRFANILISLHNAAPGTPANLPTSKTVTITRTAVDPGLPVAAEVVASVPQTDENFAVGKFWAAKFVETPNGNTITGRFVEYSDDYAGDEGTATWTQICSDDGGAGEQLTSLGGDEYEYVGLGDNPVPSGLAAVRMRLTVSGKPDATQVIACQSTALSLQVADTFTAADGTQIATGYTADTDNTGLGVIVPTDSSVAYNIRINSSQGYTEDGPEDWGSYALYNVGSGYMLGRVKMSINSDTGFGFTRGNTGIRLYNRFESVHAYTAAIGAFGPSGAGTRLLWFYRYQLFDKWINVDSLTDDTSEYWVEMQMCDTFSVVSLWDAAGTTLIARLFDYSGKNSYTGAGPHVNRTTQYATEFEIYKFDPP